MTERRDDDMRGQPPDPPEPFDPSTREFEAVDPTEERDPGRPFVPPDLEEEMEAETAMVGEGEEPAEGEAAEGEGEGEAEGEAPAEGGAEETSE